MDPNLHLTGGGGSTSKKLTYITNLISYSFPWGIINTREKPAVCIPCPVCNNWVHKSYRENKTEIVEFIYVISLTNGQIWVTRVSNKLSQRKLSPAEINKIKTNGGIFYCLRPIDSHFVLTLLKSIWHEHGFLTVKKALFKNPKIENLREFDETLQSYSCFNRRYLIFGTLT